MKDVRVPEQLMRAMAAEAEAARNARAKVISMIMRMIMIMIMRTRWCGCDVLNISIITRMRLDAAMTIPMTITEDVPAMTILMIMTQ